MTTADAARVPDGGAPQVVLVPGLNNSSGSWRPVAEHLPDDIAVHACDCPAVPDIDALADELATTLPSEFFVVGHSFGGYVALALLDRWPDRVRGTVLVNSGTGSDSESVAAGRFAKAEQARAGEYEDLARAAAERAYHPDNAGDPKLMADRAIAVREYGAERYAAHQIASAHRPDRTSVLLGTAAPKLFITASHDVVVPTAKQRQNAERVGAAIRVVDAAGHMVIAEAPAAVAGHIADFVHAAAPASQSSGGRP